MSLILDQVNSEVVNHDLLAQMEIEGVVYRQAEDGDYPSIERIWIEGAKILFGLLPTDAEQSFFQENFTVRAQHSFWVAEQDRDILGFQSYLPLSKNPFKKDTIVESSTYISERAQSKKVAYNLIEISLNYLKSTDVMYVGAFIGSENVGALKLAEKFGYIMVGRIPSHIKRGKRYDNRVFMIKLIE